MIQVVTFQVEGVVLSFSRDAGKHLSLRIQFNFEFTYVLFHLEASSA